MTKRFIIASVATVMVLLGLMPLTSCSGAKSSADSTGMEMVKMFSADSAYAFCEAQCAFGPRVMNSEAHDACGDWIVGKFRQYGLATERQEASLRGYDGTLLRSTNIIARYNPSAERRLLVCAHWDSRPWADNDPDAANHHTPVMAANDGASGVAVMLELARLLSADTTGLSIGVDFVCFDAEDWGTPQWETRQDDSADTWALGAQHWAREHSRNPQAPAYEFGILLDMVGGEGATFYREGMSQHFAPQIVSRVWTAARAAGHGSTFRNQDGGYVTDDHVPVNEVAGIPCIDIIAYYPDCEQSSFGPTWHTVSDTMDHISLATLRAVGETMERVIRGI